MRGKAISVLAVLAALGLAAAWSGGLGPGLAAPRVADLPRNAAQTDVDVELVIAVDISYSMDPDEQALQREGYILGLTSPEFLNALRQGMHGRVAVTYFEWAGSTDQRVVVAVADHRRRSVGARGCRRNRGGADAACLPHIDFRRVVVRRAAVRDFRPPRHSPRDRCVGRRRQ